MSYDAEEEEDAAPYGWLGQSESSSAAPVPRPAGAAQSLCPSHPSGSENTCGQAASGTRSLAPIAILLLALLSALPRARAADLREELDDIRARIAQVEAIQRARENDQALARRRAEEVRTLVREVLADADTRASLLDQPLHAGYDAGFYIAGDDAFALKIRSLVQFRYIASSVNEDDEHDDDELLGGFQARRTWLLLSGHVLTPRLRYTLLTTASRSNETLGVEIATIAYGLDDRWTLTAGQSKMPFLREWQVSSRYQQAVERSYLFSLFTGFYTQGVNLDYRNESLAMTLSVNDGSHGWKTDFDDDRTDYALTLRGEWKPLGEWKQFTDFTSNSRETFGLLLGAAIDYEQGKSDAAFDYADLVKYTADLTLQGGGWNLFAAFVGQHVTKNEVPGSLKGDALSRLARRAVDQFGLMIQGGVYLLPDTLELFARYEWMSLDDAVFNAATGVTTTLDDDSIALVTVGTVWYLHGHDAKVTFDVVYAIDPIPLADSGAGLRASDHGDQITLRTQFQLMF